RVDISYLLFFSSRRRHTRFSRDWSSDVCSSDLDSFRVLDALRWLTRRTDFDVRLLKGNHEQALLEFIDDPRGGAPWLRFGGRAKIGRASCRERREMI